MLVKATESADEFLSAAGEWVASDPVDNSIVLTMLAGMKYRPKEAPAITWSYVLEQGGAEEKIIGAAAFSAPYLVILTDMPAEAAAALADALCAGPDPLPGVLGPDGAAAAFARQWSRITGREAAEGRSERVLRLDAGTEVPRFTAASGHSRPATVQELDLITDWYLEAVQGSQLTREDAQRTAKQQIAAGRLWIWDDDGPVAMLGRTAAVHGVARYGPLYVTPEHRGSGVARALFSEMLRQREGYQAPIGAAFTDTENHVIRSLISSLGFRPTTTMAEYRFG